MITVEEYRARRRWWPVSWLTRYRCPHCRLRLKHHDPNVIASRCCTHCGELILQDPEPADAPQPDYDLPTDGDLRLVAERYQSRIGCIAILGVIGWYSSCGITGMISGSNRGRLIGIHTLDVLLMIVSLVLAPAVAFFFIWQTNRRIQREWRTRCHHCQTMLHLSLYIVTTTHRCPKCGRIAIADERDDDQPLPPLAAPLITTQEFCRRTQARFQLRTRLWAFYLFFMFLLLGPVFFPLMMWGRFASELWLTRQIGEDNAFWIMTNGITYWCLGCPILVGVGMIATYRIRTKSIDWSCPYCRKNNNLAEVVLVSRKCPFCLETVLVNDKDDTPPAERTS